MVNLGRVTADQDTATARVQAIESKALDWAQPLGVVIEAMWMLSSKVVDGESHDTCA